MRFLCDEMLVRLARLLRAAGYDTYLAAGGEDDADLIKTARREGRILVTRDKRLAAAADESVLVKGFGVEAEAHSLSRAVVLDWEYAPFTRCVMDNAHLREATAEEVDKLPERVRSMPGPFRICPSCGRAYWPGSHVRRMEARLHELARDAAAIPPQA
ncbi:MAG: Mut7-C RNAse domain-containing protein [Caulobacterales bacterium]|nr:Mut7-C RNAse domain-containing protein [Caulobacterales bacterium]